MLQIDGILVNKDYFMKRVISSVTGENGLGMTTLSSLCRNIRNIRLDQPAAAGITLNYSL